MVVTPNYLSFDCIILKKNLEKNDEDINTTVSFSVLCCFRSMGCLHLIITHERTYLLSFNTKEGGTQNKTHVPVPVFSSCIHIFSFVILAISNYF